MNIIAIVSIFIHILGICESNNMNVHSQRSSKHEQSESNMQIPSGFGNSESNMQKPFEYVESESNMQTPIEHVESESNMQRSI
jgi:hypothetical protein